jgi:hypothetical protein
MADITFKEYLEGRSKEEMMKNRQKLMDDFKEIKRRQKVKEQKTMAKAGKMMRRLTGGQAKLDRNKNNKIDAQDFKILRAEKAKGRGMGLQDEKMKPGKVMQARRGTIIKPKKPGVLRPKPADRYGQPLTPKPIKPKKKMGGGMMQRPMMMAKKGKMAEKGKALVIMIGMKPKKKMGGGLMEATKRLKAQGKMGGGMMMKPKMMRAKGGVLVKVKMGRNKPTKMF